MKAVAIHLALYLGSALLTAQAPVTQVRSSDLGFTYALPQDWDVVGASSALPEEKDQTQQNAASEEEKKGVSCVQIAFTARHGDPASVLVVVQLPFQCFGQSMTAKDLPGFAQGASEGIKQSFELTGPVYADYKLGTHSLWIERAKGVPKGHPESPYTLEVVCTLLKKGAACWMAMATNSESLKTLENGPVGLEGDASTALVPATVFEKRLAP